MTYNQGHNSHEHKQLEQPTEMCLKSNCCSAEIHCFYEEMQTLQSPDYPSFKRNWNYRFYVKYTKFEIKSQLGD